MRKPALTRLFAVTIAALTLSAHALAIELPEVASVPGGVAVLELPASETPPAATFNGKPVMVLATGSAYTAVVGLPLATKPGTHRLNIKDSSGKVVSHKFTVTDKIYQSQHITIKDKRKVNPEKRDMERIGREQRQIKKSARSLERAATRDIAFFITG